MSMTEEICRWAYAKAMRVDSVRQALEQYGRAIFVDDSLPELDFMPAPNRFVLSRVELSQASDRHALTYCNGVRVA